MKKFKVIIQCNCELIKIIEVDNKEEAETEGCKILEDKFDFCRTINEDVWAEEIIE